MIRSKNYTLSHTTSLIAKQKMKKKREKIINHYAKFLIKLFVNESQDASKSFANDFSEKF